MTRINLTESFGLKHFDSFWPDYLFFKEKILDKVIFKKCYKNFITETVLIILNYFSIILLSLSKRTIIGL